MKSSYNQRVPLPERNLRTIEEDVLSRPRDCFLFLDLDLTDFAGMLDDLADIGPVARSDFT